LRNPAGITGTFVLVDHPFEQCHCFQGKVGEEDDWNGSSSGTTMTRAGDWTQDSILVFCYSSK
jgi:hypothetical protein